MKTKNHHLNEEQIICSVIDQNDLPDLLQHHLSTCLMCQRKKQELKSELNALRSMTKAFAPMPQKTPASFLHVQPEIQKQNSRISWNWQHAFATGAAAIILFFGIWGMFPVKDYQEHMTAEQIIQEMEEDQKFMTELRDIEQNIMPDIYSDISLEYYNGYFDDDFLNFVAPLEEENQNSV